MQMNATQSQDRERLVKLGRHDIDYVYKDQVLYLHPKEQLNSYKLGSVMKPAWACIAGSGKGLSGMTTCYVKIFVSDINYAVNECDNKIV